MADNKIQIIIEALDKTKAAFSDLGKSIKGIGDQTAATQSVSSGHLAKLKENWLAFSAAAVAGYMAMRKAFVLMEEGAKAQQTTEAFRSLAREMKFNADQLVADMRRATNATIDDTDLMQKALKGIAQGLKPDEMIKIAEMARMVAVKQGIDVGQAYEQITDAIANNMPRALKKMGLVSSEQMKLIEAAAREGIAEVDLLSMAIAQYNLQMARSGGVTGKAAEGIQQFKAEMKELRETAGEGLLTALEKLWGAFKGIGAMGLVASAGIWKVVQAERELRALVSWGAAKTAHQEAAKAAGEFARADLDYALGIGSGKRTLLGTPTGTGEPGTGKVSVSQAEKDYQALLDKLKYQLGAKKRQEEAEKAQKEKERLDGLWLASEGAKLEAADEINAKYFEEREKDQERLKQREMELFDERERENAEYLAKMPAQMKAAREGEIARQLAELDIAEKAGTPRRETLTARISLNEEDLRIQEEYLAQIDRLNDPTGWITQKKAITEVRMALLGLKDEQLAATGTFGQGFGKGWQDWINKARSVFDQGKDLAAGTANAMNQTFSDVFFASWMGKLQSAGDYFRSFAQTILRTLANMVSEMITKWLLLKIGTTAATDSAIGGLAAETTAVGTLTAAYYMLALAKAAAGMAGAGAGAGTGGVSGGPATAGGYSGGSYAGFHTGGIVGVDAPAFYRIVPAGVFANAPRYHSGIGPGERAGIFRDDEGVFTPGQMKALGLMAREGAEKPEVKIDIANIVSPDLLDAYLATARGQNAILNVVSSRAGTLRRILRS